MREDLRLTIHTAERLFVPAAFRLAGVGGWMTRLANVIIACALLLLTLPLMVFVGVAIQCESPGPIFERHPRFAPGARRYLLLTFRTTRYPPPDALPSWAR